MKNCILQICKNPINKEILPKIAGCVNNPHYHIMKDITITKSYLKAKDFNYVYCLSTYQNRNTLLFLIQNCPNVKFMLIGNNGIDFLEYYNASIFRSLKSLFKKLSIKENKINYELINY